MSHMKNLTPLVTAARNFFDNFPRVPKGTLQPFVPFLAWYVLLQGVIQIINGFRGVSWGLHYGSLPRMFATLIDINPLYFLIGGVLTIAAGALYLTAFPKLSQVETRHEGWEKWVLAAVVLTVARLYEMLFTGGSAGWFLISALIGWYLIFEFERAIGRPAAAKKSTTSKRTKKSSKK